MSSTTIDTFLRADTTTRLSLARDPASASELRRLLGADAWNEYLALATSLDEEHLAPKTPPNLLFVPGVMGSLIQSEGLAGIWWIDVRTRKHLNDLGLSADGDADMDPGYQLNPINIDTSYEPFLAASLQQPDIGHRTYPYDWRKLLTRSADGLVERVVRMQDQNGGRRVTLVGHSMGGLMIRAALMERPDDLWPRIDRVVFVGTPHHGSPAIAGYLKNHLWGFDLMALLGLYLSRATFRSLWGVLAMLPAPVGIYPGTRADDSQPWHPQHSGEYAHPCANFDLYDADSWHLDLTNGDRAQLQRVLNGARDFHARMADAHAKLNNDQRERMAIIAGVGYDTLFRLEWKEEFFGIWDHAEKVTSRIPGDRHREGDGRVPLASAQLENVREIRYVRGVHGGLPNIPAVSRAIFDYVRGETPDLARTPEMALSTHLAPDIVSPAPNLDGTARSTPASEDPGVWLAETDPGVLAQLQESLEKEALPEFQQVKLL